MIEVKGKHIIFNKRRKCNSLKEAKRVALQWLNRGYKNIEIDVYNTKSFHVYFLNNNYSFTKC